MKRVFIAVFLFFQSCQPAIQEFKSQLPLSDHQYIVIAHRGNHVDFPENTLAAYEAAVTAGADYVEVDLWSTRDGYLVVMHDPTVNRMTGHSGNISEMDYSDLKDLRILPVRETDTAQYRIPDFASVLKLCAGRIHIYLDFKNSDVAKTWDLVREAGMEDQIVVYINQEKQFEEWHRLAPQVPLMTSIPEGVSPEELDQLLENYPISIVDNAYDQETLEYLKSKGIAVWLDVQGKEEGPERWGKAMDLGADGMQSDRPADLVRYLQEEGKR